MTRSLASVSIDPGADCHDEAEVRGECVGRAHRWSYKERTVTSQTADHDRDGVGTASSSKQLIRECVEFQYSGCGGSVNNFKSKLKCELACVRTPGLCHEPCHIQLSML